MYANGTAPREGWRSRGGAPPPAFRQADKAPVSQSTAAGWAIIVIDYVQMVLYIGLMATMGYMMFFMKKGH